MSIISDALRKVSDRRNETAILHDRLLRNTLSGKIRIASQKKRWKISSGIGTLFIIGFTLIIFLYNVEYFSPLARPQPSSVTYAPMKLDTTPEEVRVTKEEVRIKKEPVKEAYRFILNGVMVGTGESLAIVNDKILKRGDYVNGARVTEINGERVILLRGNKEIILRVE